MSAAIGHVDDALGRLQGIQVLRYIAALGVLLVHVQWKLKQFYGVTIVPVISNTEVDPKVRTDLMSV